MGKQKETERAECISFYISEIDDYMRASDFQFEFFTSLKEQWQEKQSLSEKQYEALEKMY